jgi:uncharacterized protein (DUF433 family)
MSLDEALWQDDGRMSGAVCFRNTRIPVSILLDYLEVGQLDEFTRRYPDVSSEQVHAVIAASQSLIDGHFRAAPTR